MKSDGSLTSAATLPTNQPNCPLSSLAGPPVRHKSGKTLTREGAKRQVKINAFVANLDRCYGPMPHWRPLATQFSAGTRSQFIVEQDGSIGKVGS